MNSLVNMSAPEGTFSRYTMPVDEYLRSTRPTSLIEAQNSVSPSLLTQFGDFWNSNTGKGLIGAGGLVGGLMDAFTNYGAYRQNKKNMALQREIGQYNLGRMKSENARIDRQRDDITNSWKNGQVI